MLTLNVDLNLFCEKKIDFLFILKQILTKINIKRSNIRTEKKVTLRFFILFLEYDYKFACLYVIERIA